MARQTKMRDVSEQLRHSEINIVSARSTQSAASEAYSRNVKSGGYAVQRSKHSRNKKIRTGILVTLLALLVGVGTYFFILISGVDANLANFDKEGLDAALTDSPSPGDPFWMLLVGTDDAEGGDIARSDSLILARVDPAHKRAALISIPRDTQVTIPGYGINKINAAYAYGQMEKANGHSGAEFAVNAVTSLTGAGISYYVQVDFNGLKDVVDALGGVRVDVPLDIIDDPDSGLFNIYAGDQILDGEAALKFARSRHNFDIGDFQRQADQRILLQALAKQILASDLPTITNTVTKISEITSTNLTVADIISLAVSMRGIEESDIYTYALPNSTTGLGTDGVSYVYVDKYETQKLIKALENGEYPDYSDMTYQGESSDIYKPKSTATDKMGSSSSNIDTSQYLVAVRNGFGLAGSATSVSDMLSLAGYRQGEIGNANSYVYKETLIIYQDDSDLQAADDIRARLGYGRVIPSWGRYSFDGNILVVVGGDFAG